MMEYIKKNQRRIGMTLIGILLAGISVGMFNFSSFGMDPFQVFAHGIWSKTSISFGVFYMIVNLIMLIGVAIIDRKKIGLGTMLNIFLIGYIVQYSSAFFDMLMPEPALYQRVMLLLFGIVILCFASSLYFTADLGVSTYDAVALIISERLHWKFKFCRLGSDLVCTGIGFLFGAIVGIGTLVTALFMGPLISYFNHKIAIPFRYKNQSRS